MKSAPKITLAEKKKNLFQMKFAALFVIFGVIGLTSAAESNDLQANFKKLINSLAYIFNAILGDELGNDVLHLIGNVFIGLYPLLIPYLGGQSLQS